MAARVKQIDGIEVHSSITVERVQEAHERYQRSLDNPGFCLACGEEAHGVEPDAHGYECESCGAEAVIGCEDLLLEIAF